MNKRALLFVNNKKPAALNLAEQIRAVLGSRGYEADFFSIKKSIENEAIENKSIENKAENETENPNISFSLGGDGTVLYTSRFMAPLGTPVLPVNLGSLGFISAVHPSQWEETFNLWEEGKAEISRRLMLDISIERQGQIVFKGCCLNDAVISAAGIAKLVRLEVDVESAAGTIGLGHFRADGLIVSTPTGSTAYSAAAGGPIIDPEMDALIINPVCPFTLANRPVVLPSEDRIITLVEPEQRSAVMLTVDGQITEPLECGDRISIRRAPYTFQLIASDRLAFYRALKTKLAWSGGTHA